jgi:hypothetical protein
LEQPYLHCHSSRKDNCINFFSCLVRLACCAPFQQRRGKGEDRVALFGM